FVPAARRAGPAAAPRCSPENYAASPIPAGGNLRNGRLSPLTRSLPVRVRRLLFRVFRLPCMNSTSHNLARFVREVKSLPGGQVADGKRKVSSCDTSTLLGVRRPALFAKNDAATRRTRVARNDSRSHSSHKP